MTKNGLKSKQWCAKADTLRVGWRRGPNSSSSCRPIQPCGNESAPRDACPERRLAFPLAQSAHVRALKRQEINDIVGVLGTFHVRRTAQPHDATSLPPEGLRRRSGHIREIEHRVVESHARGAHVAGGLWAVFRLADSVPEMPSKARRHSSDHHDRTPQRHAMMRSRRSTPKRNIRYRGSMG